MRLHNKEALQYLEDVVGFTMSERTLRREKAKLEEVKLERMQHIAMFFPDQHLDRIDKCETVEKLMWENYHAEKEPTKKVNILNSIISMQPYLSGYYDATRFVLEKTVKSETDLIKTPRTYVSIDVRGKREEELAQEAKDREFRRDREREEQHLQDLREQECLPNGEPLVHQDQVMPKPKVEVEQQPSLIEEPSFTPVAVVVEQIKQEEEPESEVDRYWRTHKPKYRPSGNGVTYTSR